MVLKITRFLTDAFKKQAKIAHWPNAIKVGTPKSLKPEVLAMFKQQFGDIYLDGTNYIVMTSGTGDKAKDKKRFVEMAKTVFATDIERAEIQTLTPKSSVNEDEDTEEPATEPEVTDEPAEEPEVNNSSQSYYLFLKITTK